MQQEILTAIDKAIANENGGIIDVRPYLLPSDETVTPNQMLIVIKAEALTHGKSINRSSVVNMVVQKLQSNGTMRSVRVIGNRDLQLSKIMHDHYGALARVYALGVSALTTEAKTKLQEYNVDDLLVVSGFTFANSNPDYCIDSSGSVRLGPGQYAQIIPEKSVVVLNGFMKKLLAPYNLPDQAVVAIDFVTKKSWTYIRQTLIGNTDPTKAARNSIRACFCQQAHALGLEDVCITRNGIHCSAGPLEAMREIERFFNYGSTKRFFHDKYTYTGRALKQPIAFIGVLLQNINVEYNGQMVRPFDLTEEKNARDIIDIVGELNI